MTKPTNVDPAKARLTFTLGLLVAILTGTITATRYWDTVIASIATANDGVTEIKHQQIKHDDEMDRQLVILNQRIGIIAAACGADKSAEWQTLPPVASLPPVGEYPAFGRR